MLSTDRDHYYEYDIHSDFLKQWYWSVFSYYLSEKDHFLSFNQIQDFKLDQDDEEECFSKMLTKNPDFLTIFAENKELSDGKINYFISIKFTLKRNLEITLWTYLFLLLLNTFNFKIKRNWNRWRRDWFFTICLSK